MEKETDTKKNERVLAKKRSGRPKGSKTWLPFVTYTDAIRYTKVLYDKHQDNEMTIGDIADALSMHQQKAVRVVSFLSDYYGILEKGGEGYWKLTKTGIDAANDDNNAIREVFTKNDMFSSLVKEFEGRKVTDLRIMDFIKKKYKGVDASEVKKRLTEGLALLSKQSPKQENVENLSKDELVCLIRLQYAFSPPSKAEIDILITKVLAILKESKDETLITLSKLIETNKDNEQLLLQILEEVFKKFGLEIELDKREGVNDKKS